MINISSFISYHAEKTPSADAIIFEGNRITYSDFKDRIFRAGAWLQREGVKAGDVVAVLMKNSPAFLEIAFAASHVGAIFLPINFRLSADEVSFICDNANARLLICDEELSGSARTECRVIQIDEVTRRDSRRLGKEDTHATTADRAEGDIFRLIYTSGTTDRPKGVIHSYSNFYWKSAAHAIGLGLSSATRLLVVGPLYHVGAFDLPGIAVLWFGGTLVLHREFEPDEILASIARERPTGAWFAPVMAGQLIEAATRANHDLSSLQWAVAGGERTPASRVSAFQQCFSSSRYIDAYGLTETCSGDTLMPAGFELDRIGSAGRPVAHVEISIRDDGGRPLAAGETGEICLRGPKVTCGYWNDPAKTSESFFGDWFRSGDVGFRDTDGFLFLTDRKKDMIISGGENIAASEIERVIHELPMVRDAAVIGVPDAQWGERPRAYVVLADGAGLDPETVRQHCRARLAGFKVPRDIVFRQELPRNPSGKILKRLLRNEVEQD